MKHREMVLHEMESLDQQKVLPQLLETMNIAIPEARLEEMRRLLVLGTYLRNNKRVPDYHLLGVV